MVNNLRSSVEQIASSSVSRHTKSATKGGMTSPYNSKTAFKTKDQSRTHRMQTLTASKI